MLGATLALLGALAALLLMRWGVAVAGPPVLLAAGTIAAGLGATAAALRSIPLDRCARAVDAAAARRPGAESRNADRVLIALALGPTGDSRFTVAALADALRTASALPLAAAAPIRAPRGLPAFGVLAAVAILIGALPGRALPAHPLVASNTQGTTTPERRLRLAGLLTERAALATIRRTGRALDDAEIDGLTSSLEGLLSSLEKGDLGETEVLARLQGLDDRSTELLREAVTLRRGIAKAAQSLAGDPRTGAVAQALDRLDGDAAKDAMERLAERASQLGDRERHNLSEALSQAAGAVGALAPADTPMRTQTGAEPGQNSGQRLDRPAEASQRAAPSGDHEAAEQRPRERELKRLERNLNDSAQDCQANPAACEKTLRKTANELPHQAREAAKTGARQEMAKAVDQLRNRLRRDNQGQERGTEAQRKAEQRFEQAARGDSPSSGPGDSDSTPSATGAEGLQPSDTEAELASEIEMPATMPGAGGDRIGGDTDGDPLGEQTQLQSRGRAVAAKVSSGAGPSRAQVIEAGAARGFAETRYQKVFQDYHAVVEETLDSTDVPAGRRYLVRRYFQLIRPRASAPDQR